MRSINRFKMFLSGGFQIEWLQPRLTGISTGGIRGGNTDQTDNILLRWRITGGTQRAYRVVCYALYYPTYQPNTSVIVYDSGWNYTTIQSHVVQYSEVQNVRSGGLPYGEQHVWQVQAIDNLAQHGESEMIVVTPAGTEALMQNGGNNYNNRPTVQPIAGCTGDPTSLPGLRVTWNNIALGTNEVFVRWEVWRAKPYRLDYNREWTRLADITDYATRTYSDYEVESRSVYEYFIKAVADYGATRRVSNILPIVNPYDLFPKVGAGSVAFDYVFIHDKATPSKFVRFDTGAVAIDVEQEQSIVNAWGRQQPTVYVGQAEFRRVRIGGFTERAKQPRTRDAVLRLLSLQRTDAATLVVRHGQSGQMLYAALAGPTSSYDLKALSTSISLTEVYSPLGSASS